MASVTTGAESPVAPDPADLFFAGAARGKLLLRSCVQCGQPAWPVAQLGTALNTCPFCLAPDLGWITSSGRGTLYSYAVMHQVYDEALAAEIPYVLAVVELEEGVRTQHVRLVDCPRESLTVGMALRVDFVDRDGLTVPVFRPARPAHPRPVSPTATGSTPRKDSTT